MIDSAQYDLIVIGAGPGGSNAAGVALRAGLTVAQVDRFQFPRVKPCAGGMTIKSLRAARFEINESLRATFDSIEMNLWSDRRNRFSAGLPVVKMVLRPEFDNYLVGKNRASKGFHFFDDERVTDIDYDGVFRVKTTKRTITGRQLVGADGATGIVNRKFRISNPRGSAVAIETNLWRSDATFSGADVPCFDFGFVEGGYGWVFPKDDHWSIGLYTLQKGIRDLREQLVAYIREKGFVLGEEASLKFEAHTIPVGGYRLKRPSMPVYIVGDAGGFADALTGEGIYHALESGRIAGEVAVEVARGKAKHNLYYRRLWRTVLLDTFLTWHASRVFYAHLSKSMSVLANPVVWRAFIQGYSDGATFSKTVLLGGYYFTKALSKRFKSRDKDRQKHKTEPQRHRDTEEC